MRNLGAGGTTRSNEGTLHLHPCKQPFHQKLVLHGLPFLCNGGKLPDTHDSQIGKFLAQHIASYSLLLFPSIDLLLLISCGSCACRCQLWSLAIKMLPVITHCKSIFKMNRENQPV